MPNPVATEQSGHSDAEALRDSFLAPPTSQEAKTDGRDAPSDEAPGDKDGADDEPEENKAVEGEDAGKPAEAKPEEAAPENGEKPKENPEAKPAEVTDKAKKPEGEGEGRTFKIGDRTFATVDEVVAEADRVIGRNGLIAGDLRKSNTERDDAVSALKEAKAINEQWVQWYKDKNNGAAPPSADPAAVAREMAKILRQEGDAREAVASLKTRTESLKGLDNWSQVSEIVEKLTDKENPITGEKFTPEQAYDQACIHLGLSNLRSAAKAPEAKPAEAAKKPEEKPGKAKAPIKSAAARPSGAGSPAAPKPKAKDDSGIDDLLAAKMMD